MELLITIVVIVFGFGIVTGIHALQKTADTKKQGQEQKMNRLSSDQIRKQLTTLSLKQPPKDLSMRGAMCYDMAMPPERGEYVCPVDGEKTLYTTYMVNFIMYDLPAIRDIAGAMPGVTVTIDESQFCRICSPDIKDPQLIMTVNYSDRTHTVKGITTEDLKLMREFLTGKDRHKDDFDAESALKEYIPRLEELFGVTIGK